MIGIDILDVKRIKNLIEKKEVLAKMFFLEEIEYANKKPYPEMHLTGFFCVKEAVVKALEGGFVSEIKVLHKTNGSPYVELYGKTKKLAGTKQVNVSISHINEIACAICEIS